MLEKGAASKEDIRMFDEACSGMVPHVLRHPEVVRLLLHAVFVEDAGEVQCCCRVLASIACADDEPATEESRASLIGASQLCRDKPTLKGTQQDSAEAQLRSHMRMPVVAAGVLAWMLATVQKPINQTAMDTLLQLAQFVVDEHPLQRPVVLKFLEVVLTSKFVAEALQKDAAQVLVYLMTTGFVHPILKFMDVSSDRLQPAVALALATHVASAVSPPYSRPFVEGMAAFLHKPVVLENLQPEKLSDEKRSNLKRLCSEFSKEVPGVLSDKKLLAL